MKTKTLIVILIISLILSGCGTYITYKSAYKAGKESTVIDLGEVDLDKLEKLSAEYMQSVAGAETLPNFEIVQLISVEYLPNNQLSILALVNTTKLTYCNYTMAYTSKLQKLNEIIDSNEIKVPLKNKIDIDSDLILSYLGFDEGYVVLLLDNRVTVSAGYLYTFDIAVFSQGYCYEYTLGFTTKTSMGASGYASALTTICETGAYEEEDVILITNSIRHYTTSGTTYVLNY